MLERVLILSLSGLKTNVGVLLKYPHIAIPSKLYTLTFIIVYVI